MTSPSGENPPQLDSDETAQDPSPPARGRGARTGQANLWSEDASTEQTTRPSPRRTDDVWSREGATPAGRTYRRASSDSPEGTIGEPMADDDLSDDAFVEPAATTSGGVRARHVAWELIQTLLLAALIFLMVRGVAQNFRVEGPSMEPGLHNGQYLLVNKAVYFKLDLDKLSKYLPFISGGDHPSRYLFHGPERGDVVVFRYPRDPSRDFIKRIIGVPGDTVEILDGVVSVNGRVLDEPYINDGANSDLAAKVVPEGSYFVMGDNRPNSSDSRNWGFVPEENIIGKAMFSYWPLEEFGGVGNTSIDLGFVKIPLF